MTMWCGYGCDSMWNQWHREGGTGGAGPRAQALEGAPAQLVGALTILKRRLGLGKQVK